MELYGGYGLGKCSNYGYQNSAPLTSNQFEIPPRANPYPVPYGENRLVKHILETIDQRNLNTDASDGIETLFNDRLDLIRSRIDLLLLLLDERKEIKERVLQKIDEDSCNAQTLIFEMGPLAYRMERERLSLEKIKLDLEQQKRMELVNYFRDIGMINRDLREALIQYLGETQKRSILNMEERK
jgi:hypothetical protein